MGRSLRTAVVSMKDEDGDVSFRSPISVYLTIFKCFVYFRHKVLVNMLSRQVEAVIYLNIRENYTNNYNLLNERRFGSYLLNLYPF